MRLPRWFSALWHQPQPSTTEPPLARPDNPAADEPEVASYAPTHRGARGFISIKVVGGNQDAVQQAEAFLTRFAPYDTCFADYVDSFPGGVMDMDNPFQGDPETIVRYCRRGTGLDRRAAEYLTILVDRYFRQNDPEGLAAELRDTTHIPDFVA